MAWSDKDPRGADNGDVIVAVFNATIENGGTPSLTSSDVGSPVAITGNQEISNGAAAEVFAGKLLAVSADGTIGSVGLGILRDLSYTGSAPVVGEAVQMGGDKLLADEDLTSTATAAVKRGTVINVDTTATTCDVLFLG